MPKPGQTNAITEDDRRRYNASLERMREADPDLTLDKVGARVGLKAGSLSKILNGTQKQSVQKPDLDRFFGGPPESDKLVKAILAAAVQMDSVRRHKLHERALALLDEQRLEK